MPAGPPPQHDHLLTEVLELCEDFFGHASPDTRDELNAYLRSRGIAGGPGWLTDMLGLTRLRLQHQHDSPGRDT
jgi:hypothetical protein